MTTTLSDQITLPDSAELARLFRATASVRLAMGDPQGAAEALEQARAESAHAARADR